MTNSNQQENQNPDNEQQAPASGSLPVEKQSTQATPPQQAASRMLTQPEHDSTTETDVPSQINAEPQQSEEAQLDSEAEEKHHHQLVMLEAALYVAGRPLEVRELCSVLNTRSKRRAQQMSRDLIGQYAARKSAIEILELKDERFVMQVKAEFTPLVKKLVNRPLLSSGPLKTLSYIAYRQPITSKRVIEVRGQHAYGHIKLLREMDLVQPERSGRQIVLKTTDYFADYFGLQQDTTSMKRDLKRIFGEALKDEPPP